MEVRIFFIIQHTIDRQHCNWYDERIEKEKEEKERGKKEETPF
jgi:hypothetical protein